MKNSSEPEIEHCPKCNKSTLIDFKRAYDVDPPSFIATCPACKFQVKGNARKWVTMVKMWNLSVRDSQTK